MSDLGKKSIENYRRLKYAQKLMNMGVIAPKQKALPDISGAPELTTVKSPDRLPPTPNFAASHTPPLPPRSLIERPKITKEIKLLAAQTIIKDLGEGYADADVNTLADTYSGFMDGFALAKKLDDLGWDIRTQDVEVLDYMHSAIEHEHEKVCKQWFEDNNIKPPLKVGTNIKQGIITGIYKYAVGKYLVKEHGCNQEGRSLIIKFEDAQAAA